MSSRTRWMRLLVVATGLLSVTALGAALGFYLAFVRDLPDLQSVADYRPPLSSRVLDRNGAPIGEFFVERRQLVPYERIPDHVVRAFVAGEDSTFFEHSGIDLVSIARAAWVNLLAGGEIRQGGSTITQQMVKGLLLTPERNIRRKIREMVLARDIETRFSKQEILYLYLNQIYFGRGAYGIGEAARVYYDKSVEELSISEGAQLAGLPKAPSRYSPHTNPEQAEKRRLYVLERMLADGFLTPATHAAAVADVPVPRDPAEAADYPKAAHFVEEVRRRLFDEFGGETVLQGGLVIETTLDMELQRAAMLSVEQGLEALSKRQGYRGPLRRVLRDDLPEAIAQLGEENGVTEEAAELQAPGRFEGVVVSVDSKAQSARVAFAPGIEAEIGVDDVSWAREPDPKKPPRAVKQISKVFRVGDVAPFDVTQAEDESGLQASLFQVPDVEGALLSIDVASREVLALVGGYDFGRSQFNRVTQARRQAGSSFKPFIYGAALEKGYTPASIVHDRPVVYRDSESGFVWRPRNYGRQFYGPITLREALARSVNNATVHLFRDVGVDYVMRYARRVGIESPLNRDLSLALGSSDVSLVELTSAYAVFPAGGRRVRPTFIRSVKNRDGEVLLSNVILGNSAASEEDPEVAGLAPVAAAAPPFEPPAEGEQVMAPEHAYLVTDLLRAVVVDSNGTGWRLRDLKRPAAGKTGTT
ncbi:MAG: PBP1A family penicillin-binding protein, partial [Myxococcales bacterium]|nr:PBP1A family penicillin-binding protein [Myxococcales bacterium]